MKSLYRHYLLMLGLAFHNSTISRPLANPFHAKRLDAFSTNLHHLRRSQTGSHMTNIHQTTLPLAHLERGYSVQSAPMIPQSHSHTITTNKPETFSPPLPDPHLPKRSNKNRTNASSSSKELYVNQERMKKFNGK